MKRILSILFLTCVFSGSINSFAKEVVNTNPGPSTPSEWQSYLRTLRDETLEKLYWLHPDARWEIIQAKGYAIFTGRNTNVIFVSGGRGRGLLHENAPINKDTFMTMNQVGVGFGLGAKDFRAVFIFKDQDVIEKFLNNGWQFGVETDAAMKRKDGGEALSGAADIAPGVRVYQFTDKGLVVQATFRGAKYRYDEFVNDSKNPRQ